MLAAHGKALDASVKGPKYKWCFYGLCVVKQARNPLHGLESDSGRYKRRHASRLYKYHLRLDYLQ